MISSASSMVVGLLVEIAGAQPLRSMRDGWHSMAISEARP
jgi:hypothetical protein